MYKIIAVKDGSIFEGLVDLSTIGESQTDLDEKAYCKLENFRDFLIRNWERLINPELGQPLREYLYNQEEYFDKYISVRVTGSNPMKPFDRLVIYQINKKLTQLRKLDSMEASSFKTAIQLFCELDSLDNASKDQEELWKRISDQIEHHKNIYVDFIKELKKKCSEIQKEQGDTFNSVMERFLRVCDKPLELPIFNDTDGDFHGYISIHCSVSLEELTKNRFSFYTRFNWLLKDESLDNCAVLPKEFRLEGLPDRLIRNWYKNFKSIFENFMGFIRSIKGEIIKVEEGRPWRKALLRQEVF